MANLWAQHRPCCTHLAEVAQRRAGLAVLQGLANVDSANQDLLAGKCGLDFGRVFKGNMVYLHAGDFLVQQHCQVVFGVDAGGAYACSAGIGFGIERQLF